MLPDVAGSPNQEVTLMIPLLLCSWVYATLFAHAQTLYTTGIFARHVARLCKLCPSMEVDENNTRKAVRWRSGIKLPRGDYVIFSGVGTLL